MNNIESNTGEIVMYQPDETIRLEVRVENETVWLTQQQMAELFMATKQNISLHIKNIYDEGELEEISTVKDYLTVRKEGKRTVRRHVNIYNLDVIISVGYRVKSIRGTRFRQWANRILKEYLLNGYSINRRFEYIEQRLATAEQKIDFFVRSSLPPVEGIFYDGQRLHYSIGLKTPSDVHREEGPQQQMWKPRGLSGAVCPLPQGTP